MLLGGQSFLGRAVLPPASHVPEDDPAVLPGRGQQRAVRRDGDRMHDAVMALQLQANGGPAAGLPECTF